jgi:hypothetical protein
LPLILDKVFAVSTSRTLELHNILLDYILKNPSPGVSDLPYRCESAGVCDPTQLSVACLSYRQVEVFL